MSEVPLGQNTIGYHMVRGVVKNYYQTCIMLFCKPISFTKRQGLVKHKSIQVELYAAESPKPKFVKWIIILLANISQLNNYYKKVYFYFLPTLHLYNNVVFYVGGYIHTI